MALTAPFVGLIVLAVGLAGYLSFCNGRRAMDDATALVRAQITQRIQEQLHSFLNAPHQINQINADAIGRGLPDARDARTLERSFWAQIQAFESMTSIYFGNTAGGLINSGRDPATDSQYVIGSPGFASGPLQKYAVDAQGNRTALLATVPSFDARTRPWYIKAVEKGGPVWSPIYILSTGQDMAIAASHPVYDPDNALLGVVSVDIFLSHIGAFLRSLNIGQNGQCFIMDRSGLLIASSTDGKLFTDDAGPETWRRLRANETRDTIIRLAAAALTERFGDNHRIATIQQARFESDGARYFLEVSPVQDARGLDWLACVVICEADFMSRIEAGNRQTLLLVAGTLLLTLIIGLAGAKRIARPISGLHSAAQGLAKGQWPQTTDIASSIREVSGLKLSFEEMAVQLRKTIESLKHEVAVSTKTQAALRESEERWQFALEGAGDGVWDWNVQTDETFFSKQGKAMLGFEDSEIGNSLVEWDKRVHPDDRDLAYAEINKHFAGETPVYISEHRLKCKDETYKWIFARGKVIRWTDDGKPLRMIGTHTDISDRKRAEEDLRSNQALLEGMLNGVRDVIGIQRPDHSMIRYNKAGYDLLGLSPSHVAGRKCYELVGKVNPCDICSTSKAIQNRRMETIETFVPELDRHFLCTSNPILRPDGEIEVIIEQLTDITDRKLKERALQEREENLKTLFDSIDDFLFIIDAEGCLSRFNLVVLKRLGYAQHELMSMPVTQLHPPERREEAARIIADMLAGKTSECLVPLMSKDERIIPVESRVSHGTWNGQPVLFAICRDISERVAAQDALEQSEEKYRTLFENAPIGIAVVDRTGHILDANDAMYEIHGKKRAPQTAIGNAADYFCNDDERESVRARLLKDGFLHASKVRLKKGDSHSYHGLLTMSPVSIRGKRLWLAMIQDITELEQYAQALAASLKEKDLLLREVHHRVKNNMQIMASLLRLQASKAEHPQVSEIMEDCQSRIRAMALVHETLYHAEGLSYIRLEKYLLSLIGSVVQTILDRGQIAVRLSVLPPDIVLPPDKAISFGLVVSELLTNALKHAFSNGRSGTVWIKAHQGEDRELNVTVSDDGTGLPRDLDVRKTDTLGLELVVGLVEHQLEGDISWRVKNGTTFIIRFVP